MPAKKKTVVKRPGKKLAARKAVVRKMPAKKPLAMKRPAAMPAAAQLPATPPPPPGSLATRPWTDQDIAQLRTLKQQGLTNPQIAAEMNRTEFSIDHKAKRLKIRSVRYAGATR